MTNPNLQYPTMRETQSLNGQNYSRRLNPAEIAKLAILAETGLQNKHIAFLFGSAIQTIKNQLNAIYSVLCVKNRSSAILVWQTIREQYPLTDNVWYTGAKEILAHYGTLESFTLHADQWDSEGSQEYPEVIRKTWEGVK